MSQTPTPPAVSTEKHPNGTIVRVAANTLEEKATEELVRAVGQAPPGPGVVAIDLSRVQMVPSMALGALVQLAGKCRARQQTLRLVALTPAVRQVFRITRLDRAMELVDTLDTAMLV